MQSSILSQIQQCTFEHRCPLMLANEQGANLFVCIIAHYWPLSAGRARGHDHAFSLFNQDIGTSSRADKSAVGAINPPLRFPPNAIPQSQPYESITTLAATQLPGHRAT